MFVKFGVDRTPDGCSTTPYDSSSKWHLHVKYIKCLKMSYKGMLSFSCLPPLGPKAKGSYPVAHVCVTVRASVMRRVFLATFFEMSFSRTISSAMGVSVLHPSLSVRGWIIRPLFGTISEMTWNGHWRANDSIELEFMNVWDVPMIMNDTRARSRRSRKVP